MLLEYDNVDYKIERHYILYLYSDKSISQFCINNLKELAEILARTEDVYKIEVIKKDERYNNKTGEMVERLGEIGRKIWVSKSYYRAVTLQKNYQNCVMSPTIEHENRKKYGIKIKTQTDKQPNTVFWHPLNAWNDVVMTPEMKQIYPKKTNRIPIKLQSLFNNGR